MALRLGIDLDGVLADMHGELMRQAGVLFGAVVSPATDVRDGGESGGTVEPTDLLSVDPAAKGLRLTPQQQHALWMHVGGIHNFWETLSELESGTVARLWATAQECRWEILFLTKRPPSAGVPAQQQTQRWLANHGFVHPSTYVVQGSRGRIAAALDLDYVVDDRPENCLDVVIDSNAEALLVWPDSQLPTPGAAERKGIQRVRSMNEGIDRLRALDRRSGSLASRVKRMLKR